MPSQPLNSTESRVAVANGIFMRSSLYVVGDKEIYGALEEYLNLSRNAQLVKT
jgi:hypothetical protein